MHCSTTAGKQPARPEAQAHTVGADADAGRCNASSGGGATRATKAFGFRATQQQHVPVEYVIAMYVLETSV